MQTPGNELETIPRDWLEEFEAAARRPLKTRFRYAFIHTYKRSWTTNRSDLSTRWRITGNGAKETCLTSLAMAAFEYRQAEEIRDALQAHQVRYLFIGKSGAILLGYPDTTQQSLCGS